MGVTVDIDTWPGGGHVLVLHDAEGRVLALAPARVEAAGDGPRREQPGL